MSCKFCHGHIIETPQFNTCSKCGMVDGTIFVDQEHRIVENHDDRKKESFHQYVEKPSLVFGCGTTFDPFFSARFHKISKVAIFYTPSKTRKLLDISRYSKIFNEIVPKHITIEAILLFKKTNVGHVSSIKALYLACLKVVTRSRNVLFSLKDACNISHQHGNRFISEHRVNRVIFKTPALLKIKPEDRNAVYLDLVCNRLKISFAHDFKKTIKIISRKLLNTVKKRGFNPLYISAAAVYTSIKIYDAIYGIKKVTMDDVCNPCNIKRTNIQDIWYETFRPIYKKLLPMIQKDRDTIIEKLLS